MNRNFDKLKAKFRNKVKTVVDVMTSMTMLPMAFMVYVVLRVEQCQGDNQLVKKVKH